jgi:hypothetical protein
MRCIERCANELGRILLKLMPPKRAWFGLRLATDFKRHH